MNKPLTYKTPGRECAHADSGCCPKCLDPLHPQKAKSVPRGTVTTLKTAWQNRGRIKS